MTRAWTNFAPDIHLPQSESWWIGKLIKSRLESSCDWIWMLAAAVLENGLTSPVRHGGTVLDCSTYPLPLEFCQSDKMPSDPEQYCLRSFNSTASLRLLMVSWWSRICCKSLSTCESDLFRSNLILSVILRSSSFVTFKETIFNSRWWFSFVVQNLSKPALTVLLFWHLRPLLAALSFSLSLLQSVLWIPFGATPNLVSIFELQTSVSQFRLRDSAVDLWFRLSVVTFRDLGGRMPGAQLWNFNVSFLLGKSLRHFLSQNLQEWETTQNGCKVHCAQGWELFSLWSDLGPRRLCMRWMSMSCLLYQAVMWPTVQQHYTGSTSRTGCWTLHRVAGNGSLKSLKCSPRNTSWAHNLWKEVIRPDYQKYSAQYLRGSPVVLYSQSSLRECSHCGVECPLIVVEVHVDAVV